MALNGNAAPCIVRDGSVFTADLCVVSECQCGVEGIIQCGVQGGGLIVPLIFMISVDSKSSAVRVFILDFVYFFEIQ